MGRPEGKEDKGGSAPAPVANPARVKTNEGFKVAVVVPGAPDLILTFDSELLREKGSTLIQNSVKRGAVANGFPVKCREGKFWFCHIAYVKYVD